MQSHAGLPPERTRDLRVSEVMTRSPLTIDSRAHLSDAVSLMEAHGIRHLPVMQNGHLIALLSERHVRDALPSVLTLHDPEARRRFLQATRLEQVWIEKPLHIAPQATVLDAISLMRKLRAGSLPVVDEGRLVGILTSADLITALERLLRTAPRR